MTVNELIDIVRTLNEWELVKFWKSLDNEFLTSVNKEWFKVPEDCRDKIRVTLTRAVRHQVGDTVAITEDYKNKNIITLGTITKIKKDISINSYDVLIEQDIITTIGDAVIIKGQNCTIKVSIAGTW